MMRTFLYAMPSSGATYVAWTMSQSPRTIGLLDFAMGLVPNPTRFPARFDVVAKDTAGSKRSYVDWLRIFKPDRVVIVTKDPSAIRKSIIRRYSKSLHPVRFLPGGIASITRRFRALQAAIDLNRHDEIVRYEDVVASKPELPRSLREIAVQNHLHCEWCRSNSVPTHWHFGGIHVKNMSDGETTLLFRTVRYYGQALSGHRYKRRLFVGSGLYMPPLQR